MYHLKSFIAFCKVVFDMYTEHNNIYLNKYLIEYIYIVVWCTNNNVNFPYYFKHKYYNNKH